MATEAEAEVEVEKEKPKSDIEEKTRNLMQSIKGLSLIHISEPTRPY